MKETLSICLQLAWQWAWWLIGENRLAKSKTTHPIRIWIGEHHSRAQHTGEKLLDTLESKHFDSSQHDDSSNCWLVVFSFLLQRHVIMMSSVTDQYYMRVPSNGRKHLQLMHTVSYRTIWGESIRKNWCCEVRLVLFRVLLDMSQFFQRQSGHHSCLLMISTKNLKLVGWSIIDKTRTRRV